MRTRSYSELKDFIAGLSGVNNFVGTEESYIRSFANRRFKEAHNASEVWPRYLVVGDERTIQSGQYLEYAENGEEVIKVHRTEPNLNLSAMEYDFWTDATGIHIVNIVADTDSSAFVTYKKPITYLTSDNDTIPEEFFYFMGHATYADFLRLDGQQEKAIAEEQIAQNHLANELMNVQVVANNNQIKRKFFNHLSRQSR